MNYIQDLFRRHASKLTQSQRFVAKEMVRRVTARREFSFPKGKPVLEAQSGFILVERVFSGTPVNLFGQDIQSLAHSRISILRSKKDDSGAFVPAEVIYSGLISEKSLTEAVFLSNRGEGSPMTNTFLGDYPVAPRIRAESRADRTASQYRQENLSDFHSAIEELETILDGGTIKANAKLRQTAGRLEIASRNLTDTKFALERHVEERSKLRSEVLTEAAHAALHSSKVEQAIATPLTALPPPGFIDANAVSADYPMVSTALDLMPHDWKEALRKLIVAEIKEMAKKNPRLLDWIAKDDGIEKVNFPSPRDYAIAIKADQDHDAIKSNIARLSSLWTSAFNPHVEAARQKRDISQASISVSQRSGWTGHLHSSLPPADGHYSSITICPAWEEESLGASSLRSSSAPLVQIEISTEDLMVALRGHPEGHPVPCSLTSVCGVSEMPAERPKHDISTSIEHIRDAALKTPEVKTLRDAIKEFNTLVNGKRSGKAWRKEVDASLKAIRDHITAAHERIEGDLKEHRKDIDSSIAQSASDILKSISRSLPKQVVETLFIT